MNWKKTPGPGEVLACPQCGGEATQCCWHPFTGRVTTVIMPRTKAAGLKAEHIAGLEADLVAEREALASLMAGESDAEMLDRLLAEARRSGWPSHGPRDRGWEFDRVLSERETKVFVAWVHGPAHSPHTPPKDPA